MIFINKRKPRVYRAPMSEMNVTPMIDVMLVLLVIFMVTAPLLTVGVKVDLPTGSAQNIIEKDVPIVVYIKSDGVVFIGEVEVELETLTEKLRAITNENLEGAKIFVRGDKALSYGKIITVMSQISAAGFKKVVLVTELPKKVKNASR